MMDAHDREQEEPACDFPDSGQLHRNLFEESPYGVFITDPNWRCVAVNPQGGELTGYSREEILDIRITDLVPPGKPIEDPICLDELRQGKIVTRESCIRKRDGTMLPLEIGVRMLPEGNYLCIARDITELKRAEEQWRASEERYRSLYEENPSMYFTVDPDGTVLSVNRFGCEQLGFTARELVGQPVLKVFHDEDKEAAAMSIARCVENLGEVFHWELRKMRSTGSVMWVKETARAVRGPAGNIVVFIVCEDITDLKAAEEEKVKLQAQLLQARKMESIGRLAGGVAHDFNNMLSAILGHVELAMMRCTPSLPIQPHLRVIQESALRSADLIRQLLAFARKQTVIPRNLDLNNSIENMLKMLLRLIGEDIDLVWMPGAGLWRVRIDPSQIDQILANLCVNARDAIAGVGKVTIETDNAVFDETLCAARPGIAAGDYVKLAVSDDGCGMSNNVIDHLFEPFFTTKDAGKGTGLGLATVYGIVRQNDGFINVDSEPGKGATIAIYLPRFMGEATEPAAETAAQTPRGRGETVLLVEDEEAILDVGKAMLEELGYVVLTAGTPCEALRMAKAHAGNIHLLITDVVMPEMNGRDLANLLRNIKPELRCLFMSGYTADVIAHRGVADEGVNYLQKPFFRKDLASKVRRTLE